MHLSVAACVFPVGDFVGERQKCVGVDVSPGAPAPIGELGGSHIGLNGPDALALDALECLLRGGFPLGEGGMPCPAGKDGFE